MAYSPAEISGEVRHIPRIVEFFLAKRTLQVVLVVPVTALVVVIVKNPNRTIAELVTGNTGYFYWIAAAALCLKFRHKIRLWLDRSY
jgi:hypothetical protein